jgi:hypothetical protein
MTYKRQALCQPRMFATAVVDFTFKHLGPRFRGDDNLGLGVWISARVPEIFL